MTIDDDMLVRIREVLDGSGRVDTDRIDLAADGATVVLRGAVATPEEASAAALIAEREVPTVRNELRIDHNLREDPAGADLTQTATARTGDPETDLPGDVEAALGENLPWDPPDEPALAPTRAEQRGVVDRDVDEAPPADAGPLPEADATGDPAAADDRSAADLSAAELADAARPDTPDAEDRR